MKQHKHLNNTKDILTSYEIVWATLRKDPNKEYLELEVQPATKVLYTLKLEIHRNIKTLKFIA